MKLAPTSSSLQHQRVLGIMFILISAAAFGAAPIFAKYAYEYGTEPITLMFLRFTLASGIMLIYTFLKQKITPLEIIALILALIGIYGGNPDSRHTISNTDSGMGCYRWHFFSMIYSFPFLWFDQTNLV